MEKGKYQLTPLEVENLKSRGLEEDEINDADQVVSTFKDWINPDYQIPNFGFGISWFYLTPEKNSAEKGNGKLTLFILPEEEYNKIQARKREIVEGFVEVYAGCLIEHFERGYQDSKEKQVFWEREINRVQTLLFDRKSDIIYSAYGDGLSLRFQNFSTHWDSSMWRWYERFCVNSEMPPEAGVAPRHHLMTAQQLNNHSQDSLHFVVAALALNRFKEYLMPVVLTFEDWESGSENWKDVEWLTSTKRRFITQSFERMTAKSAAGKWSYYTLSHGEYKKIAAARLEIFERKVNVLFSGLIEGFEATLSLSLEKNDFINAELENVLRCLTDSEYTLGFSFKLPHGEVIVAANWGHTKQGESPNPFYYWYNLLVLQGQSGADYITLENRQNWTLPVQTAALYQYQKYLKGKTSLVGPSENLGVEIKENFKNLFVSDEAMRRAIKAAEITGIIDERGRPILGPRKIVSAIIQFWEAVSDRQFGLTDVRAEREDVNQTYLPQCRAIAQQWGTDVSKSAVYDNAGNRSGGYFSTVSRALGGT